MTANSEGLTPYLRDVWAVVRPRWAELAAFAAIGAVLLGGVAFMLPPTYTADTKLLIVPQSGASLGGAAGVVAALTSAGANPLKNPNDLYVSMLNSRRIQLKVIESQGLGAYYGAEVLDDVVSRLSQATRAMASKDNLVRIEVVDGSPVRAAAIANAYAVALQETTATLALTDAQARKQFLGTQVQVTRKALAAAEDALGEVSKLSGILDAGATVQASASVGAELEARLAVKQAALSALMQTAGPENVQFQSARSEVAALETQVRKNKQAGASGLTEDGKRYARALREVKYQEALFEGLSKQYELARVDAAHDSGVVQVLDEATPPARKTGPKRSLYALVGLFLGGFVGFVRIGMTSSRKTGE